MNTTTMNDRAVEYRYRLANELTAAGVLNDRGWRRAWETVPRQLFVRRFAIGTPGQPGVTGATWYDGTDPETRLQWLEAAYRNEALITNYAVNGTAISSSTEPSLMAQMLHLLDVHDGQKVLEVGTGTGYNAALLAHRLDPANITTIDVDHDLARTAKVALDKAGYPVTVLTGDGADGAPEHAPFDRIIATCGVDRIPAAWIKQLAPGGAILANVSRGLILLRYTDDNTVSGRFCDQAGFMPLHTAADPPNPTSSVIFDLTSVAAERQHNTDIPADLDFTVASFLASLVAERSDLMFVHREDGAVVSYRWWHPASESWVRVELHDDRSAQIHETGPRHLWAELAPILAAREDASLPDINQFGLTITPQRHMLWIGAPDSPHRWTLPS